MNLLLTNARLVTMENDNTGYQVQDKQFINVLNGKISQIGPMQACPNVRAQQIFD